MAIPNCTPFYRVSFVLFYTTQGLQFFGAENVRLTDYARQQMKHDPIMLCDFAHQFVKPAMKHIGKNNPQVRTTLINQ
jgi:hypothetical protein